MNRLLLGIISAATLLAFVPRQSPNLSPHSDLEPEVRAEIKLPEAQAPATANTDDALLPSLSAPAPTPARFETADCEFLLPPGHQVECGFLTVPEDHSLPDGRSIQLHVALVKSRSETPDPDPLVFLHGGPGARALNDMALYLPGLAEVLEERDLIVFDQRGVGRSKPALDCQERTNLLRENLDQKLTPDERVRLEVEANLACHDRLVSEGINLTAYTSAESAADINDLRLALGYEEWNLYGVSYGSRLALTVMRDHPEGIRSVILDSVYPPQVDLYAEWAQNAQRAFDLLFERCAADVDCIAAFPELQTAFFELVEQLQSDPIMLQVPTLGTDVLVDGHVMTSLVSMMLNSPKASSWLPRILEETESGNYSLLSAFALSHIFPENSSRGMHYSVQCAEEARFSSLEARLVRSVDVHPNIRDHFSILSRVAFVTCNAWTVGDLDPIENRPVHSEIPTLILMGELDPITPPVWGRQTLESLQNAYLVEIRDAGHFVLLSHSCVGQIAQSFLSNPESWQTMDCSTDPLR